MSTFLIVRKLLRWIQHLPIQDLTCSFIAPSVKATAGNLRSVSQATGDVRFGDHSGPLADPGAKPIVPEVNWGTDQGSRLTTPLIFAIPLIFPSHQG